MNIIFSSCRASLHKLNMKKLVDNMATMKNVKIILSGHVDDLYTLSLLFSEGAYPGLYVVTNITGRKDGLLDRVQNFDQQETYLTGDKCLPILEAKYHKEANWIACKIIEPLNGYAVLSDSNFKPVTPVSAAWEGEGSFGGIVFGSSNLNRPTRLITANRHDLIRQLLSHRVSFMRENPIAASAAAVIVGTPSWAEYYRLLEDIAGYRGTTLDKLPESGLADRKALNGFKTAANNRASGRHGMSKRRTDIQPDTLMNLVEAREFIRTVVSTWLDIECGGRMPRDRVDGGPLRFGLDKSDECDQDS